MNPSLSHMNCLSVFFFSHQTPHTVIGFSMLTGIPILIIENSRLVFVYMLTLKHCVMGSHKERVVSRRRFQVEYRSIAQMFIEIVWIGYLFREFRIPLNVPFVYSITWCMSIQLFCYGL